MARPRRAALPDDTQPRIKAIVERSLPNADKPELPGDAEKRFAPVEHKTAACYAGMEENTVQLRRISSDINELLKSAEGQPLKSVPPSKKK